MFCEVLMFKAIKNISGLKSERDVTHIYPAVFYSLFKKKKKKKTFSYKKLFKTIVSYKILF